MDDAREVFFDQHPDPTWVADGETQRFVAANEAAIRRYGYTREQFLSMTLDDLRAPDTSQSDESPGLAQTEGASFHPHRLGSGESITVQINGRDVLFNGRPSRLLCARDVTGLLQLERECRQSLERETQARRASEIVARRFQALFAALPGRFLVLSPHHFEVLAASDAYLHATGNTRERLIGRPLFDTFSAEQLRTAPHAAERLRESLQHVLANRRPDTMRVQAFPPPGHEGDAGARYWHAVNSPVLDASGSVAYIFHRVEEVTELVRRGALDEGEAPVIPEAPEAFELTLRTRELSDRTRQLEAQVAELRNAQELLAMATWTLDLNSGKVAVSTNFHKLFGCRAESFTPDFEGYLALVHPEDRESLRNSLSRFGNAGASSYQARHRIIRADNGRTMHVTVVGEFHPQANDRVLTCIVQDMTAQFEAAQELNRMSMLARLAGRAARLGGWRLEVASGRMEWEAQTFAIFGLPAGKPPDIPQIISFYAPEDRTRIRRAFDRCVSAGESFDTLLQFINARQERISLRTIGEAERDAAGQVTAIQGAFQDVDEVVRARHDAEALSRRLTLTLESISDAFFTLDREWRFTYLNSQAERLLQRNRMELLGRVVWDEFPAAVGTMFETEYERVARTGETARFDQDYPPLGMRFRVNAYPVSDGIAVYFQDITLQHAQESRLRLLQAAAERMSDMLVITDAPPAGSLEDMRIIYVNEAFEQRTGYARDEVIGRTPDLLHGPRTQQADLARVLEALKRQEPVRTELINYTRSGEEIWVELNSAPIADAEGRFTHWVAVARDVTDRRRADELARINDERFRLIARTTNDVIWDWDIPADTMWWNDAVTRVLGHEPGALARGQDAWSAPVHADDRARVLTTLRGVLDGTESTWTSDYRFMHADGRARSVTSRGFVIRDADGRAVRMIGSIVDNTERLELDAQLRQAQKLEAVGHLTGGVAHDFNNLLTVILGNAALLTEALVHDAALRELAAMIDSAAQRGAELTQRMLAFSRRQALDPKVVDLNALIAGLEAMLRRTLPEDIDLSLQCAGDLRATEVDTGQLEVALLNLVVNARDAMPGGGSLVIETRNTRLDEAYARHHVDVAAGDYVEVAVRDTGCGVPAEIMDRVFDPFFTTKEVGKGSGLGLSMVYGFVKQSRGHVRLESEPGQGTTVRLFFLSVDAPAQPANATAPAKVAPRGGHEHVLVVEDDDLVRGAVVEFLQDLGYRVTAACNGSHALELLPGLPDIALLFTDVVMPGMSGRELVQQVRAHRPDIRVLFTSGYTEDVMVHNGRLDAGVHLLSKPYRRQALAEKVREALDSPA